MTTFVMQAKNLFHEKQCFLLNTIVSLKERSNSNDNFCSFGDKSIPNDVKENNVKNG